MGTFNKGLNRDTSGRDQPKGTWSYAKNALIKREIGGVSNEKGTGTPVELNTGYSIVGIIEVDDYTTIIFSHCAGCGSQTYVGRSEIGIFDHTTAENSAGPGLPGGIDSFGYRCLYNPNKNHEISTYSDPASDIYYRGLDVDLNFHPNNPITGTYRYNSEGDLIIYWTDDNNPPRFLNVTKQRANIQILTGFNTDVLYGKPHTEANRYHSQMLSLSPSSSNIPKISSFEVLFGGSLRTGNYILFVAYEDDKRTRTNYVSFSMPVYITDEPISKNNPYAGDGAVDKVISGKSISWSITKTNPDYKFLKCLVVERHVDSTVAYELDSQDNLPGVNTVTFTGNETASISSPQEAVKDHVHYSKAKTLEILESTHYMGNLESTPTLNYQKYANFIKVTPVMEYVEDFDLLAPITDYNGLNDRDEINIYDFEQLSNSYRNPQWATNKQGYMRDEIYALYIAFIKKDGSMTPAFHIPGREAIGSELQQYKWGGTPPEYHGGDSRPEDISADFQKFEFRDYSSNASNPTGMNYWENKDEYYPDTLDWTIEDANNPGVAVGTLKGEKVRHHHFPRNTKDDGSLSDYKSIHTWLDSTTVPAYVTTTTYTGNYWFLSDDSGSGPWTNEIRVGKISQVNPNCSCAEAGNSGGGWHEYCGSTTTHSGSSPYQLLPSGSIGTNEGVILTTAEVVGQAITFTQNIDGILTNITRNITGVSTPSSGAKAFQIDGTGLSAFTTCSQCCPQSGKRTWSMGNIQGAYEMGTWRIDLDTYHASVTTYHGWRQNVNILGFKLSDLKVPLEMAMDLQGFRVYRAKRRKKDKTILDQSVMIPMMMADGYRYSNYNTKISTWIKVPCRAKTFESGNALGTGFTSYGNLMDASPPFYNITDDINNIANTYHGVSFHGFSMLKNQSSIVPATHFHMQYDLKFDVNDSTNHIWQTRSYTINGPWSISLTTDPIYVTSAGVFMFGLDYQNTAGGGLSHQWPHFITESAKAYCPARSIFNPEGNFGADMVHNVGGETSMIFKLANPGRILGNAVTDATYGTTTDTSSGGTAAAGKTYLTVPATTDTYLTIANLKSVKRNVYNSFDDQELEWTGYEVIGEDFQRFVVHPTNGDWGNFYSTTPVFETEMIYGGDTFLTRYAFRSTWDSNSDAWAPDNKAEWSKSCSYRALYSIIVESVDNINYRHSTGMGTAFFPLYSPKALLYSLEGACVNSLDYRVTVGDSLGYAPGSNASGFSLLTGTFMGDAHFATPSAAGTLGSAKIPFDSCAILDLTAPTGSVYPGNVSQALTLPAGVPEGILYNIAYSQRMDLKTPIPYPKVFTDYTKFPTRIVRSLPDNGVEDGLRLFYSDQYIDIDKSRGYITDIFSLDNLLYIHSESALLKTRGKQKMQTSEGVAAIGSGDIFSQTPEEVIQTTRGYAGSVHLFAGSVTSYGYIWLDYISKTVYRMTDKIEAISDFGLSNWFNDNIPHVLEQYGMNKPPDSHTAGIGFHCGIDYVNNRWILTKREAVPTALFISLFTFDTTTTTDLAICWFEEDEVYKQYTTFSGGFQPIEWSNTSMFTRDLDWTVSFQLDANAWVSYHDYVPSTYISSKNSLFGFSSDMSEINQGLTSPTSNIYEHNVMFAGLNTFTSFYSAATPHSFHIEYVSNKEPSLDKGFYNITYTIDTRVATTAFSTNGLFNAPNSTPKPARFTPGFTSYFVYNDTQISNLYTIQNLVNTRKVGSSWKLNDFRDLASQTLYTNLPSFGANTSLPSGTVPGTVFTNIGQPMILEGGMNLIPNTAVINLSTVWSEQKRFTSKYLKIHLISDNTENILLTLHDSVVGAKPYLR